LCVIGATKAIEKKERIDAHIPEKANIEKDIIDKTRNRCILQSFGKFISKFAFFFRCLKFASLNPSIPI
jgi:hypothetical protein